MRGNEDAVAAALDRSLIHVTSNRSYNNEDALQSAIYQIRDKQYFASLDNYRGDILFAGINYDENDKTNTCIIENFSKE